MKFYSNNNVYEESINRIEYFFDEFEEVIVGFSGGKDSTVTLNLALEVAEKKNRLPLKVLFIDQEAEWQGTIDYVKEVMYDNRVEPLWFQMPSYSCLLLDFEGQSSTSCISPGGALTLRHPVRRAASCPRCFEIASFHCSRSPL